MNFRVELIDATARGYVCENYGAPFRLPELGPIGSNGLAKPRDFLAPVAAFEANAGACERGAQVHGRALGSAEYEHSPLDVVAWHGNYAPYKYDLARFKAIGSVSFDHRDPSIFTVLTSPSQTRRAWPTRLRHLPAALAGGRAHLPPAVVPPQRDERADGPGARHVRRQGRRLPARRRLAAQLHDRRTAPTPRPSTRASNETLAPDKIDGHARLHVGVALRVPADALRARVRRSCRTTTKRVWDGLEPHFAQARRG